MNPCRFARFMALYALITFPLAPLIGYGLAEWNVRSLPAAYIMMLIFMWPLYVLLALTLSSQDGAKS